MDVDIVAVGPAFLSVAAVLAAAARKEPEGGALSDEVTSESTEDAGCERNCCSRGRRTVGEGRHCSFGGGVRCGKSVGC